MMNEKPKILWLRRLSIALTIVLTAALGVLFGIFLTYQKGLPAIQHLEELRPSVVSDVYDDQGRIIGKYYLEKRVVLSPQEMPDVVKKAFIAVEDSRFYSHWGVDFVRIFGAIVKDLYHGRVAQGASTISMQLARTLFLSNEKTFGRKLKETLLTFQIERMYTKEQILNYYLNNIYLGYGNHGIEAASIFFFGKSSRELKVEDAALLAGINSSVGKYSPLSHPERALVRRNYALRRMREEKFITQAEYERAKATPLQVVQKNPFETEDAMETFIEEVRKFIASEFGNTALYKKGLKVYTTVNATLQQSAFAAVQKGVREQDKRRGWRKDKLNLLAEGREIDSFAPREWKAKWQVGETLPAVVLGVEAEIAYLKVAGYRAHLALENAQWTRAKELGQILKRGDVVDVQVLSADPDAKTMDVALEQEPKTESAFLAMDPKTGAIKAMIGGYSFDKSEFNRALQAKRQPGSTIKPIIYSAALSQGYTTSSTFMDEPVTFYDRWTRKEWTPHNFDMKYRGLCTLRRGLEESRNIMTAKLLEAITPETAIDYAKKFGIQSPIQPYLSMSLGTFEVTMQEMVAAYSTFANKGRRPRPFFIKKIMDSDGNVLFESRVRVQEVLDPQVNALMVSLLRGVVLRGTAQRARSLGRICAGKTGTTDDYTDAWFIGFTPSVVAAVWIGHDQKKTLGYYETGARAALPIWISFMETYLKRRSDEGFPVPEGMVSLPVDYYTGLPAGPNCKKVIDELFVAGTEPTTPCSDADHRKVRGYAVEEGESHDER